MRMVFLYHYVTLGPSSPFSTWQGIALSLEILKILQRTQTVFSMLLWKK